MCVLVLFGVSFSVLLLCVIVASCQVVSLEARVVKLLWERIVDLFTLCMVSTYVSRHR